MSEEEKDHTPEQTPEETPEETPDTQKEILALLNDFGGLLSNMQQSIDKLAPVESEQEESQEESQEEDQEVPEETPEEVEKMLND